MSALLNSFTFLARKNYENTPNKLIVTKCIRCTFPMFNNIAFLALSEKVIYKRIVNKKPKSCKPKKMPMTIFNKKIPAGSVEKQKLESF